METSKLLANKNVTSMRIFLREFFRHYSLCNRELSIETYYSLKAKFAVVLEDLIEIEETFLEQCLIKPGENDKNMGTIEVRKETMKDTIFIFSGVNGNKIELLNFLAKQLVKKETYLDEEISKVLKANEDVAKWLVWRPKFFTEDFMGKV